tara:strand:+ start:175 stop:849 length:675 start_codon:yes stop_codon:yes gene_type:complete
LDKLTQKTFNLIGNYGWLIFSYFLFFAFMSFLSASFPQLDMEKYRQTELFKMFGESPVKFILMAVIVAPILEEAMFRTLIKPSKNELYLFICAWFLVISSAFFPIEVNWILKYIFLALCGILLFIFLKNIFPKPAIRLIQKLLLKYYKPVWFATAIIFGLVHIYNYVDIFNIDMVLFLLIFPRILAGFFFGKVKIENSGLIWPILMHSMNNSIVVVFMFPQLFE